MSNPHVTIDSFPSSDRVSLENETWAMNVFGKERFYPYKLNEKATTIDPTKYGSPFNMAYALGSMNGTTIPMPDFVGKEVWDNTYTKAPSIFVTANNSVMPKMITPSAKMIANGFAKDELVPYGVETALLTGNFNWHYIADDSNIEPSNNSILTSASDKSLFINLASYNDSNWEGKMVFELRDGDQLFTSNVVSSSGVNGAFALNLNVIPKISAGAGADGKGGVSEKAYNTADGKDATWLFEIKFGDVTAKMTDVSALMVHIDGGTDHETTVNLSAASAPGGPPQIQEMGAGAKLLTFFPCWNGAVVMAGVQDTNQVVYTASTICNKYREYSLMQYLEQNFDKENPKSVNMASEFDKFNYAVDFGNTIKFTARNCEVKIAYVPVCFVPYGTFDNWQLINADTNSAEYEYELFYIYAANSSPYQISVSDSANKTAYKDDDTGLDYTYFTYAISASSQLYERIAGEIFGYYIRCKEKDESALKNSNGTFSFDVSGSDAQGTGGNWTDYISNVSVTTNLQSSSGSITIDGLGFAGTGVSIKQSVGGISISASGGNFTNSGTIFKGLALGIGVNASSGGTELNIPLVGVEKKLQDMALINPPFLDGWTLNKACDYLFGYAGINYEMKGDGGLKLSSSTQMTRAIFDWKSGTSVDQALSEVMLNTHHNFAIIDGTAVVSELGDDGLPKTKGPDRKGDHTYLDIVTYDQTPDFEDLRNYCVGMGIASNTGGVGTQLENLPIRPITVLKENSTTPKIPWARVWAQARPGYSYASGGTQAEKDNSLDVFVNNMCKASKVYHLTGKITIAGDASIKIWDYWGSYIIYSVSHNVDMQNKQWTTSLELMATGDGGTQTGPGGGPAV